MILKPNLCLSFLLECKYSMTNLIENYSIACITKSPEIKERMKKFSSVSFIFFFRR